MVGDEHGEMKPKLYWESGVCCDRRLPNGKVIQKEYDAYVRDLVNYVMYMGEPAQLQRKRIGYVVMIFLFAVMLPLAYFLKKNIGKTYTKRLEQRANPLGFALFSFCLPFEKPKSVCRLNIAATFQTASF